MEKRCFLLICLLFALAKNAHAQNLSGRVEAEYVYTAVPKRYDFDLTHIEQTDSSTNVFVSFRSIPGDTMDVRADFYLEDWQRGRHAMRSCTCLTSTGEPIVQMNGTLTVCFSFEPLSNLSRPFDMLGPVTTMGRTLGYWGIHPKGKNMVVKKKKDNFAEYKDATLIRTGKTTVKGRFKFPSANVPDSVALCYRSMSHTPPLDDYHTWAHVNKQDGTFEVSRQIDGLSWTYIKIGDNMIPLMLAPDNELSLTIENDSSLPWKAEYRNASEKDTYANLMYADPLMINKLSREHEYNDFIKPVCPTDLAKQAAEERLELEQLASYLSAKHKLTPMEYHLLRINLLADVDGYEQERLLRTLERNKEYIQRFGNEVAEGNPAMLFSEEFIALLSFMRNIDANDLCHLVLPDKKSILNIEKIPFLSMVPDYKENATMRKAIETYLGEPLPDTWLRLLRCDGIVRK